MRGVRTLIPPALWLVFAVSAAGAAAAQQGTTSCLTCHGDADLIDDAEQLRIVADFGKDVHAEAGLSCHGCHGGDPDLAVADDLFAAMDEGYAANPYLGAPERAAIPAFCGRCHSDPEYMKRFKPAGRVDQEREYATSVHGRLLAEGDTRVATCIDCHGVHGMLPRGDPQSPVYPTHVAETCRACHGDADLMADSTLADGRPLPVDQYARWRQSAHGVALMDKGDLFAPACNDCHGNHGAAPPGIDSVAFVCGSCHGREATLFRASSKREGFGEHNDFDLADLGDEPCAECHEPGEPQTALTGVHGFSECTVCHGNHSVVRPTVAQLGRLPETPCAFCHEAPEGTGDELAELPGTIQRYEELRDRLVSAARDSGIEGAGLFDHLVGLARVLPSHTRSDQATDDGEAALRPEFARLFDKFRIGTGTYTYTDESGTEVREELRGCTDCHGPEDQLSAEAAGWHTAGEFLDRMRHLTALTARAERMTLQARRGGVEIRDALLDLDKAVDAQIELEVLVHSFDHGEDGAFAEKHGEGLEHARAALDSAHRALGELRWRRTGLAISLVVILFVLLGLALKIRQLTPSEDRSDS